MKLRYLHIIVPQGEEANPKKEQMFQQFLNNLYRSVKGKVVSLEIFGYKQYAYFYMVVPEKLHALVEGLVYSTYPDCEIRESKDYCEFAKSKNLAFAGSRIKLKRTDIYPILNFEDFEVDCLSGVFSVISKIQQDEQIWIQLLVSPKDDNWRYHLARRFRMWRNRIARIFRLKNYMRMKGRKEFYGEEKKAFVEKAETHPFRFEIRLACFASDQPRAAARLEAVAKAFYQFNKIDYNEFTKMRTTSNKGFLDQYMKRNLSESQLISAKELAGLYHFPNADHVPHVVHVLSKKAEAPQDAPKSRNKDTSFFGVTNYHNNFDEFGIDRSDRRRHLYVVGKSGTGKSKLLELFISEDIKNGEGVAVLDPHGDLVDNIVRMIPEHRKDDVIYFDPGDVDFPVAFNPLVKVDESLKMQMTVGFINIFKKLFGDNWSDRLEHVLRYTVLALLDSENTTVLSILKMLSDKNYRQTITARIQDSVVKNFWVNEFAGWSEKFDAEAITPLLNKVGQFVATNMIRNIIGQPDNKFNIREVMDKKKILLMKVSKGLLGEENSNLLGAMIVTQIYQAAMSRADTPEAEREDFYLYVDEFQNFATETFEEIMSEARKYKLNLTIAHQFVGQLTPKMIKTVFGNVGSMLSFRVGAEDAQVLENEYNPVFKVRDIINLAVRDFYIKMSVNGEVRKPFSGRTLEVIQPKDDYTEEIISQSRIKYATPVGQVDEMLTHWDESGEFDLKPGDQNEEFEEPLI
ncbi:type IV secretory system conjugative DNA transfer family protein [Patescibacteria group bacterium]